MPTTDLRVNRPGDKEVLIQQLRTDAGFPAIRDVLLFAAAVGFREERRTPFTASGEPIRHELLLGPAHANTLVSMLAACSHPDDPEILAADRLGERLLIFEEYANGGLDYLQGELNRRREAADLVCAALASDALADVTDQPRPVLKEIVDELTWD